MKDYFKVKFIKVTKNIQSQKDNIAKAVTGQKDIINIKDLTRMGEYLKLYQDRKKELVTDIVEYLSARELLELAKEEGVEIPAHNVQFYYKNIGWVSLSERDALVKQFGYQLRDARVK